MQGCVKEARCTFRHVSYEPAGALRPADQARSENAGRGRNFREPAVTRYACWSGPNSLQNQVPATPLYMAASVFHQQSKKSSAGLSMLPQRCISRSVRQKGLGWPLPLRSRTQQSCQCCYQAEPWLPAELVHVAAGCLPIMLRAPIGRTPADATFITRLW